MDRLALTKALKAAGVSDSAISFSSRNDKYCLIPYGPGWVITLTERGAETFRHEFLTENDACAHLFGILTRGHGTQI